MFSNNGLKYKICFNIMYFKPESAINVELLSNRVTVKMPFLRLKTWWRQTLGFPVICSFLWISVMILKFKVDQCWLCLQFVCFIYFDVLQFVYVSFCWMRYSLSMFHFVGCVIDARLNWLDFGMISNMLFFSLEFSYGFVHSLFLNN